MKLVCSQCGKEIDYPSDLPAFISLDLARQYASEFFGWTAVLRDKKIKDLCCDCRLQKSNSDMHVHLSN
jgi:hypothetical protein